MLIKTVINFLFITLLILSACKKNNNKDNQSPEIPRLVYPYYVSEPVYNFEQNELTQAGITLGRILFYDPILSSDSSISCASCHDQAHAFADHNVALSHGVNNLKGNRNSPALYNLAWQPSFMWDGGVNHIEIMPLAPITNHVEMNENMENIILKLQRNTRYKQLFKNAFGKNYINDQMMFKAFAQFMGTIVSFESKYDKVKQKQETFTPDENEGYALFQQHCNSCHTEPLFTNFNFANNGIDSIFKDEGRYLITLDDNDLGKFKIPSLRNVNITYPYMHDGRFRKLEDVLEHYTKGIKPSGTMHETLKQKIDLSEIQKKQIILFLKTLTDYQFLTNNKLSQP